MIWELCGKHGKKMQNLLDKLLADIHSSTKRTELSGGACTLESLNLHLPGGLSLYPRRLDGA